VDGALAGGGTVAIVGVIGEIEFAARNDDARAVLPDAPHDEEFVNRRSPSLGTQFGTRSTPVRRDRALRTHYFGM
jgi:hypothetical protein